PLRTDNIVEVLEHDGIQNRSQILQQTPDCSAHKCRTCVVIPAGVPVVMTPEMTSPNHSQFLEQLPGSTQLLFQHGIRMDLLIRFAKHCSSDSEFKLSAWYRNKYS